MLFRSVGKKALEKLGHGSDEDMRKDLQKKMGVPQTGKKPTSEEVEQIDELSKSTLSSYLDKKKSEFMKGKTQPGTKEYNKDVQNMGKAYDKMKKEEVEQIDELTKSTLGSYVKGAARDMSASRKIATDFEHRAGRAKKSSMKDAAGRLSDKFNAIEIGRAHV